MTSTRGPAAASRRIESGRNAAIREARAIERERAARTRAGVYIAWGVHLAQEAVAAGARLRRAFIGPALEGTAEGRRLRRDLADHCPSILHTTSRLLDSIVAGSGDQGVLLIADRPRQTLGGLIVGAPTLLLVTHGVQDPGNLGSIVRTTMAFGGDGLILLDGCTDAWSSRAIRAAMGAQFRLPIVTSTSAPAITALRGAGLRITAADPAADRSPLSVNFSRPTAIVVGNEGAGLPDAILQAADLRVRIPMAAGVTSINVHAAATTLLYEASRQRGDTR